MQNNSIKIDLFKEESPIEREVNKNPELLVFDNDAPVKKRKFNLGRNRKKTPKKSKKQKEEIPKNGHNKEIVNDEEAPEKRKKSVPQNIEIPEKREVSKDPELLVFDNDTPVKKRKFNLGKNRKKTPKKSKKPKAGKKPSQKKENEIPIIVTPPKIVAKAVEIDLGFESKFYF